MADCSRFRVLRSFFAFFLSVLVLNPNMVVADGGGGAAGGAGESSESCNTEISSFLLPPYSNMTKMVCTPIWNSYTLRYSQTGDHVVTIILSTIYTTGWIGIGFSRDGSMVGSSAMVAWLSRKGHAKIKQYYLQGFKVSQVIPDKGELPLTNVPSIVVLHGASIYMAFQLKFPNRVKLQPLLLAFGSVYPVHSRLSPHDDKTTTIFDFSKGSDANGAGAGAGAGASASATHEKQHINIGQMKQTHGILGIVGWGLILPCGAMAARYLKHKETLSYYLHSIIQFIGFIIALASIVVGRTLYDAMSADQPTHKSIGIVAFVFAILQVGVGFGSPVTRGMVLHSTISVCSNVQILAFFVRPSTGAKIRMYWNWYHHWIGRLALFLGALNVVIGIQIGRAGSPWKIGYGFLLGIVLVAVIVLEALKSLRSSAKPITEPSPFQTTPIQ